MGRPGRIIGRVALALGPTLVALPAAGQEFCVACVGPEAVYRCQLENVGPRQTQPLKIVCITTLAREGRHESCSVRGGTVLDCNGPIRRVNAVGKATPGEEGGGPAEPFVMPEPGRDAAADEAGPPKTVEEAVRRAARSTGESASKAGQAISDGASKAGKSISDGARKTWNCVTSLFKAC